jgi:hypothetical protein
VSLLLSWENPPEMYTRAFSRAILRRGGRAGIGGITVNDDVAWGAAEDPETDDPSQDYTLEYVVADGSGSIMVINANIRRYVRPATICEITFDCMGVDGAPEARKTFEFSDLQAGAFTRTVITNASGKAVAYFMPGSRLLMREEGKLKALDFVVPDRRLVSVRDLELWGSLVDTDRRGWY